MEMQTYARLVAGELSKPTSRIRTMPFAISHPDHVTQRVIMNFPTPLNLTNDLTEVSNPAFKFSLKEIASDQRVELVYHYRSLKNQVSAGDMPAYLKAIDAAEDVLVYGITVPTSYQSMSVGEIRESLNGEESFKPTWILFFVAALALLLSAGVSIALYFWNPAPRQLPDSWRADLIGLGGWLALVAFNVLLVPVVRLAVASTELLSWDQSIWISRTHPDYEDYHLLWEPSVLIETVFLWSMIPYAILLVVLFFQKRTSFPLLMTGRMVFDFVTAGIVLAMFIQIDGLSDEVQDALSRDLLHQVLFSLIWIPYLAVSKRVKLTFVHRRGGKAATPPPLPPRPPPIPSLRAS